MEDKKIIKLLTLILLIPMSIALNAWVFMYIFNWFIVPLHPEIIPVGFKISVGISVFLAFFNNRSDKKEDESVLKYALNKIGQILFLFLIAYLIHLVIS